MTKEGKAKAYDEALERARELLNSPRTCFDIVQLKDIFPQLKESEDERIRKAIESVIRVYGKTQGNWIAGYDMDTLVVHLRDAFAYLEKPQLGEQKPAEWEPQPESLEALMYAIEGKWEMIKPTSYLSRRLEDLYEGLVNTFHVDESFLAKLPKTAYSAKDIEELKKLKDKIDTSMDGKPADFPTTDEEVKEFLETYPKVEVPEKYKTPDFVFSKQEYESHPIISKDTTSVKPAEWSAEDEAFLKVAIAICNRYSHKDIADWLKSLRPQPHWKPSEEQILALERAVDALKVYTSYIPLISLLEELKKRM